MKRSVSLFYMNKPIVLSIIIFVTCFISCNSKKGKESEADYSMELVETKKITLPIDENTYYLSKSIFQFEEDGREYLHFENTQKSMYDFVIFDLEKQDVHKRIPLVKEGPDGVISVFGSKPFPDSNNFLVSQHLAFRISLVNGDGEVQKNYQLKSPGKLVRIVYGSFGGIPTFCRDSLVYFSQSFGSSRRMASYANTPMFATLDLRNGDLGWSDLTFPMNFDGDYSHVKGGETTFTYDYNPTDGRLVCAFIHHDSIMVSDDLQTSRWYCAKSRYLPSMRPNVDAEVNDVKDLIHYDTSAKYHRIVYDKYRDVYYRFAEMPCDLAKDETPYDENAPKAREFSVIVLDKDFRIVGETKFPGNKYLYKMSFVGRDGLYISENNLANPDFDEDKLVFACMELRNVK